MQKADSRNISEKCPECPSLIFWRVRVISLYSSDVLCRVGGTEHNIGFCRLENKASIMF